jgi:hypothetical protein
MYVMAQLPLPLPPVTTSDDDDDDGNVVGLLHEDVKVCRHLVEDYGIAIIPGTYCGFSGWIRSGPSRQPASKSCATPSDLPSREPSAPPLGSSIDATIQFAKQRAFGSSLTQVVRSTFCGSKPYT